MKRQPDSRTPFGQVIEDQLDAISESTRRDTRQWVQRLMRGAPGDNAQKSAIIGGIASGLLDELWTLVGDADRITDGWAAYADAYFDQGAEDEEADKEPD